MESKGFKMIKYPLMRNNFNKSDFKPIIDLLSKNDPKLTQGSNVEKFEIEWSKWLGVKHKVSFCKLWFVS